MRKLIVLAALLALVVGCAGMGVQAGVCTGGSGVMVGYKATGEDGMKPRAGVQVQPNCGPAGVSLGVNLPEDWKEYLPKFVQDLLGLGGADAE